jgi:alanyl-tRNA synthetase
LALLAARNIQPTNDDPKFAHQSIDAKIVAIWNGFDLELDSTDGFISGAFAVILDSTNFYSEMGGQVGDRGEIRKGSAVFDVVGTLNVGGYVLHVGHVRGGIGNSVFRSGPSKESFSVRDTVTCVVSADRPRTEKNHTTTHVANWALREVLGDSVEQKGSLVDPDKLRFDFSHGKSMSDQELSRVEGMVREQIARKLPVYAEVAPQEQALKIHGLRAVFGEKYPPMVRVVSIGAPVKDLLADPANPKWRQFSIEFCGGTHLSNTADAQSFCLAGEESVSKGIRRIVALTGDSANAAGELGKALDEQIRRAIELPDEDLAGALAEIQKTLAAGNLPLLVRRRAQAALTELQARQRTWDKKQQSASSSSIDPIAAGAELLAKAQPLGPGKLIVGEIPGASDEHLRLAIDWLKKKTPSYGILLGATDGQKVNFVAVVSDDLIARGLKAGDWVREAAKTAGGGGGGRPQMAQAGGKDPAKLSAALEAARNMANKLFA